MGRGRDESSVTASAPLLSGRRAIRHRRADRALDPALGIWQPSDPGSSPVRVRLVGYTSAGGVMLDVERGALAGTYTVPHGELRPNDLEAWCVADEATWHYTRDGVQRSAPVIVEEIEGQRARVLVSGEGHGEHHLVRLGELLRPDESAS